LQCNNFTKPFVSFSALRCGIVLNYLSNNFGCCSPLIAPSFPLAISIRVDLLAAPTIYFIDADTRRE
jgi:hypothetical protein